MFSLREMGRYNRQILLFGEEGQEKIQKSHIIIAGAGGLGSPVSIYLAVAGVGTITLVDRDVVDQTNLNRQILYHDSDIGKRKTSSAREKLTGINPDITVNVIDTTIDATNADIVVGDADGIVDAMDNFSTRYLLNKVAIDKRIPFFHGGIRGFHGQATTIIPGTTPCLRCIFPTAPPVGIFPVLGVTPGLIGMVQATEVLKYLLQEGRLLTNRLFLWDGFDARAEEIVVQKNPCCPDCGTTGGSGGKSVVSEENR